jgi:predicted deacylase
VITDLIAPGHIDSGNPGPHVVITAGVHGDEYEPMLAAMELKNVLPGLLQSGRVTIIAVVNKSAYAAGNRLGDDGLDLARTCPGNPQGSVTEKIADAVSKRIRAADYFIDMHTGGRVYDIYPLAGYMLHPSAEVLEKQRSMAIAFNMPVVWGTDYRLQGRTLSVARDSNVPAIYVEYGGGSVYRENITAAYKQGCINVIKSLGMIASAGGRKLSPQTKYKVEDHSKNSGYLQNKMHSPAKGIFIADVKLGTIVKKSQVFGKIVDPADGQIFSVKSDKNGLVFLLRADSFVQKGDSLGGILPISKPGNVTIYGK